RTREPLREVAIDALHAVIAFRSERHVRIIGGTLGDLWDPLAGDYRATDGWVRLHTNYLQHRAAALRALGVAPERAAVASAITRRSAQEVESAVVAAGGGAAAVRSRDEGRGRRHRGPRGAGGPGRGRAHGWRPPPALRARRAA